MSTSTLTAAVPKPDHVPDALVYDFDLHHDPALKSDGYARVLDLVNTTPPVFWTPRNGGQWILRSHAAVFKASRDPESFSNSPLPWEQIQAINASLPEGAPKMLIPAPITLDPPHHATFRSPIQGAFSPKSMAALKDDIRSLCIKLIDQFKGDGHCEFMAAVAEPLPVQVFLKMFGLPISKQREYRDLVTDHLAATDNDSQATQARLRKVAGAMREAIVERQHNPQNDILSLLWQAEFNGRPATQEDLENYAVMLFLAGLDTVYNGMGLGVHHLATHPELQADLRANPKLIPDVGEELLRRYTFTVPVRFIAKDIDFDGIAMKKGEKALIFLPGADLDSNEFDKPEAFDLARENKVHIAFGTGPHRCLGSHLARIELQILYEELMLRLPEFRLDPEKPVTYHGGHVIGPDQLHLIWNN